MLAAARDAEHLKYAKATELANTQLSLQAQQTNELISAHARTLRTSQLETSNAIAKINEIRGHAEGFAENMLEKATDGLAPDLTTTWAAFSGVLTQATIDAADWKKGEGATKKKVRGPRSVNVFNITAFQGAEAAAPPTPIQHAVFQLTDAKVNAQPTPDGYEAPVDHSNFLIPWATAAARRPARSASARATCTAMMTAMRATTRKRKRTTTTTRARRRYRAEKSVSRELLWPLDSGGETPKLMGRQWRWKNSTRGDLPLQKTIFCLATLRSRLLMHRSAVRGLRLIDTPRRGARDLSCSHGGDCAARKVRASASEVKDGGGYDHPLTHGPVFQRDKRIIERSVPETLFRSNPHAEAVRAAQEFRYRSLPFSN